MTRPHTQHDIRGRAPLGLSAKWGPAAGAQIQTSPGASALAAPLQSYQRWPKKWLGVVEAALSLAGLAGLVGGLYLLGSSPIPGVMSILASMTLLLSAAGKLAEEQEARCVLNPVICNNKRTIGEHEWLTTHQK